MKNMIFIAMINDNSGNAFLHRQWYLCYPGKVQEPFIGCEIAYTWDKPKTIALFNPLHIRHGSAYVKTVVQ